MILCTASVLFAFSSCLSEKDYTCECDYIVSNVNQDPNAQDFQETSTVKARILEDARSECGFLEGKYATDHNGTCVIQ